MEKERQTQSFYIQLGAEYMLSTCNLKEYYETYKRMCNMLLSIQDLYAYGLLESTDIESNFEDSLHSTYTLSPDYLKKLDLKFSKNLLTPNALLKIFISKCPRIYERYSNIYIKLLKYASSYVVNVCKEYISSKREIKKEYIPSDLKDLEIDFNSNSNEHVILYPRINTLIDKKVPILSKVIIKEDSVIIRELGVHLYSIPTPKKAYVSRNSFLVFKADIEHPYSKDILVFIEGDFSKAVPRPREVIVKTSIKEDVLLRGLFCTNIKSFYRNNLEYQRLKYKINKCIDSEDMQDKALELSKTMYNMKLEYARDIAKLIYSLNPKKVIFDINRRVRFKSHAFFIYKHLYQFLTNEDIECELQNEDNFYE